MMWSNQHSIPLPVFLFNIHRTGITIYSTNSYFQELNSNIFLYSNIRCAVGGVAGAEG